MYSYFKENIEEIDFGTENREITIESQHLQLPIVPLGLIA